MAVPLDPFDKRKTRRLYKDALLFNDPSMVATKRLVPSWLSRREKKKVAATFDVESSSLIWERAVISMGGVVFDKTKTVTSSAYTIFKAFTRSSVSPMLQYINKGYILSKHKVVMSRELNFAKQKRQLRKFRKEEKRRLRDIAMNGPLKDFCVKLEKIVNHLDRSRSISFVKGAPLLSGNVKSNVKPTLKSVVKGNFNEKFLKHQQQQKREKSLQKFHVWTNLIKRERHLIACEECENINCKGCKILEHTAKCKRDSFAARNARLEKEYLSARESNRSLTREAFFEIANRQTDDNSKMIHLLSRGCGCPIYVAEKVPIVETSLNSDKLVELIVKDDEFNNVDFYSTFKATAELIEVATEAKEKLTLVPAAASRRKISMMDFDRGGFLRDDSLRDDKGS